MYTTKDLAVIIPTKDRPKQVKRHLESLAGQNCELERVIVVASGQDIKDIVLGFKEKLPVEYYRSESGQIRQRNLGISKLNDLTKLVATMDDDITYKKNAINNMIDFWNKLNNEVAGIGFNIVNLEKHRYSPLKHLFGMSAKNPGRVLKSGVNTWITNVNQNIKTQWLNGGATVWRKDILLKYKNEPLRSKWAIYEDVIYSYNIGKQHRLYVCSAAQVEVDDSVSYQTKVKFGYFSSNSIVLWRYLFILKNEELSKTNFFLVMMIHVVSNFIKSIFLFKKIYFYKFMGLVNGLIKVLFVRNSIGKLIKVIEKV